MATQTDSGAAVMELIANIIQLQKVFYLSSLDSTIGMKIKELIQKEIEVIPEPYLEEVLDFIHFLKEKASKKRMETAILSEPVLAKDWQSSMERIEFSAR